MANEQKCGMKGMMGCGSNVAAQPAINMARKVPSADGVLHALICTLGIEGKKNMEKCI